jgi:hypothetical protein
MLRNAVRQLEPVHATRHLYVGEQQRDIGSGLEDGKSLLGIHGFDRSIAGIFDHIDRQHAE